MTTGPAKRRRPRHRPRPALHAAMLVVVLTLLLLPLGYLSGRSWIVTADAADAVASERDGVAYARPLTRLLAALVEAQAAAGRGGGVDAAAVRAAVDAVNQVDRGAGERLGLRSRWAPLPGQVEDALRQRGTGPEATRAYAVPIGLTQALLARVGDVSRALRDPETDSYHLVDAALVHVPETMISAGRIVGLVRTPRTAPTPVPAIAVAQDRVATAAQAVTVGLRTDTGAPTGSGADLGLLEPLDEFSAAVGAIVQVSTADPSDSSARGAVDAAQARVQKAAAALVPALLTSFESILQRRAEALDAERITAATAGIVALLAAAALLWLCLPRSSTGPGGGRGPRGAGVADIERTGDLVDARDLLAAELAHMGRGVRAERRTGAQ